MARDIGADSERPFIKVCEHPVTGRSVVSSNLLNP